jgi:predicted SnoaL-like aldol condensation-catalyzing enzyme
MKGEIDVAIATKTIGPELVIGEQRAKDVLRHESIIESTPRQILQSALEALSLGRFSEVVTYFDDRLKFNDHSRTLEFTDKLSLTEFFQKSRERYPDSTLEIVSLFEDGDHAIAEWKLTATQTIPYAWISYRSRIYLRGTTIVRVENGRIVEWADYYDQNSSHRSSQDSYWLGLRTG